MVAEHVHDADRREGDTEELRPLGHDRADEEAAVRAPGDGQPVRRGVLLLDEILGRGDEIVEDVLFLVEHAGLVPGLAVLAAAAQVGLGEDAAVLQEDDVGRAEAGRDGDVEAAVGREEGRVLAVELEPFLVDDEHRDFRPVLARVENLLRLVAGGVELDLARPEDLGRARGRIELVDRRRISE